MTVATTTDPHAFLAAALNAPDAAAPTSDRGPLGGPCPYPPDRVSTCAMRVLRRSFPVPARRPWVHYLTGGLAGALAVVVAARLNLDLPTWAAVLWGAVPTLAGVLLGVVIEAKGGAR